MRVPDSSMLAMRPSPVVTLMLALAAGVAIGLAWPTSSPPAREHTAARGTETEASAAAAARGAEAPAHHAAPAEGSTPNAPAELGAADAARRGAGAATTLAVWPVSAPRTARAGAAATTGEPLVPVRLAFLALWYLGVDPAAETTWSRAINDPRQAEGVRSDLIVDMVDEGYTDNDRPGLADLALIQRRLEILERYAPHAMDEVNAQAFEEAYRTLLELYLRLGGEARIGRGPR